MAAGGAATPPSSSSSTSTSSSSSSSSSLLHDRGMQQLIPIVNKLQDVFAAIGKHPLDLPQIVVIGSQSSGKSSVLEHIVGRDFLPRGTGIVTRRPLILQLYNTAFLRGAGEDDGGREGAHGGPEGKEWGEFLHRAGERFYDFMEIREEIKKETDRLTGKNKGISAKSINLKIYSPYVLNLTLVDLPGITKVSVGDQPVDIEAQIREMCLAYIANPNSIVLAVTAANTDIANSDSLKLAREVDPEGLRTIGVLTKMDLMDPGTDAADVLLNRVIPLRIGYVAVVNRGQRDIDNNLTIREALRRESSFFKAHPVYRSLLKQCTTPTLTRMLNNILMHHIRDCLPEIKSRIQAMTMEVARELDALGEPTTELSRATLGGTMLGLLSRFASTFQSAVEGKGNFVTGREGGREGGIVGGGETLELYGGARINYIFSEIFGKSLMGIDPFATLTDEEIRTAICNANGTRPALFVPEISFDLLVKRQISRLEQPGLQCVDLVFDELLRMAAQCETTELTRFPELRDRVVEVVNHMLRKCVGPTQVMISNLINIELAYINTSHPDFIGGSRAVAQLMERMAQEKGNAGGREGGREGGRGGEERGSPVRGMWEGEERRIPGCSSSVGMGSSSVASGVAAATSGGDKGGGIMSYIFGARAQGGNGGAGGGLGGSGRFGGVGARDGGREGGREAVVKLPQVPEVMRYGDGPNDREKIETEIIKALTASYFDVVRKNFMDLVPKTIMYFLVNHAKDNLQNELVSNLYREDLIGESMRETADVAMRRKNSQEMRVLLQKALEIVNEVRDFNTFKL
ncbi:dynamin like protein [Nannochloropsis oceanica]